jgi:hypothetical protein
LADEFDLIVVFAGRYLAVGVVAVELAVGRRGGLAENVAAHVEVSLIVQFNHYNKASNSRIKGQLLQ